MTDEKDVLSRMVSRGIRRWKEKAVCKTNYIDAWLLSIVYQTEKEAVIKGARCGTCLSKEDKEDLEKHHPAGKMHTGEPYNYRTVTLCRKNNNCHGLATSRQRGWGADLESEDPSPELRRERLLIGICDLIRIRAERTGDPSLLSLADEYTEDIRELSERRQKKADSEEEGHG